MASIVEIQDLTNLAAQSTLLHPSDSTILDSINIISGFQPTPPLSPEHIDTGTSPSLQPIILEETHIEDQTAEALLDEMLKCQQLTFSVTEDFPDSQGSFSSSTDPAECLLDTELFMNNSCKLMWNSHEYEPRSLFGGPYTPAPSPPPEESSEESKDSIELGESVKQEKSGEDECISPCDIFPTYVPAYTIVGDKGNKTQLKRRLTTTSVPSDSTRHSRATSSESDEEIDVVTVTVPSVPERMTTRLSTRKNKFSTSSAPCSRQASPHPPSPKKRKISTKRTSRVHSVGSGVGEITESDDEHRRASHNILERKRRNDLKSSFQLLREQVPDLEDNQRAPKVTILRKAAEYINLIHENRQALDEELTREKEREAKLRQRLAYLKSLPIAVR